MDKLAGALGLAKRAGQTVTGTELIQDAVRRKKAALVLAASDASEGSVKKLKNTCLFYGVRFETIPYTKSELSAALGMTRLTSAVSIRDHEILKLINTVLCEKM